MNKQGIHQTIHPLLTTSTTQDTKDPLLTPSSQATSIEQTNYPKQSQSNLLNNSSSTLPTDALLFQNLRAQAQELGLDSHSLGWAIIQSIHNGQSIGRGLGTYASLIESLLHSTNLLLLLPKATLSSDQLTPELLLHHILLTTPSHQGTTHSNFLTEHYLCNLNGWKGLMGSDQLVFTSPGTPILPHQINHLNFSFVLSKVKPSTSISNELTSPSQLRFPIYNLLSPPFRKITIPRLNSAFPSRGNAAQRLASLFASKSESEPLTIHVRVCDRALDSFELDQSISRAISSRIKDGLGSLEENMLQIIQGFISRFSINYNPSTSSSVSNSSQGSLHLASNEEIAQAMQEMYQSIDHELEQEYQEEIGVGGSEDEKRMIIDHTLELIEEVVCVELYDRLFEDNEQDEKLSEKIAQLNLLDITLDHLGLDLERREMDDPETISTIRTGLDDIIRSASLELSRLQDNECRSPRDKVGVYVTVHKLIVDGLSSLPPIPMKKEGIPTNVSSRPLSQDGGNYNEVEMSHNLDRTKILTDSSTMDRSLPMPPPLRPLEKDQPSASDLLDAIHTNLIDPPAIRSSTDDEDLGQHTPKPQPSKPNNHPRPNSSSADLILPLLIYLIIKANPNRLESNLNYANRFRYDRLIKGETDYCLVNFSVSCEFIKSFRGLGGSDLFQTSTTTNQIGRPTERSDVGRNLIQRDASGESTVYGTFASNMKSNKERNGNTNEVEDAFIAASRAVGGVLMEGYQKVISSSLLDTPVAKLGLAGGPRSGPRTLEDVKKLIGSGSNARRSEGNMSSWSDRMGLIRRNLTNNERRLSPHRANLSPFENNNSNSNSLNGSNAVKRISSLFQQNSSAPSTLTHHHHQLPTSNFVSQSDEDRVTISQRLSSIPGLSKLNRHQSSSSSTLTTTNTRCTTELHSGNPMENFSQTDENRNIINNANILVASIDPQQQQEQQQESKQESQREQEQQQSNLLISSKGPIERLENCTNSDHLLISEIPLLLADYQRLCKIGRSSGLWS